MLQHHLKSVEKLLIKICRIQNFLCHPSTTNQINVILRLNIVASNIYNSGIIDPNQMRMTNTSVQPSSILQNNRLTVSTSALPQSVISGRNTTSMSSIIPSSNNFNPIFQVEKKSGPTVKEKQYQIKITDLKE